MTRLSQGQRVLPPFGLVNVNCQKVAGVIRQQRIDTNGAFASQVIKQYRIGQRDQFPVAAISALDAGLFANTG
jgi:hypothetical protein